MYIISKQRRGLIKKMRNIGCVKLGSVTRTGLCNKERVRINGVHIIGFILKGVHINRVHIKKGVINVPSRQRWCNACCIFHATHPSPVIRQAAHPVPSITKRAPGTTGSRQIFPFYGARLKGGWVWGGVSGWVDKRVSGWIRG